MSVSGHPTNKIELHEQSVSGEQTLMRFENGKKVFESFWCKGKLSGKTQSWYIDGNICLECEFLNGLPHGLWKVWYPNGQIYMEGRFHFGEKLGSWKKWNENGQIIEEVLYPSLERIEEVIRQQCLKLTQPSYFWKLFNVTMIFPFFISIMLTLLSSNPIRGWSSYRDSFLWYLKSFPLTHVELNAGNFNSHVMGGPYVEKMIFFMNLVLILTWLMVLISKIAAKKILPILIKNIINELRQAGTYE